MVFLRQLRLLRRDGTAQMHPRKKGDEQAVLQHMDEFILHERNITSKRFHVKVSVAT